jgi:hypothetical protein
MNLPTTPRLLQSHGRPLLRGALERIEAIYRRRSRLAPVGPLLYIGIERHDGVACEFPDGTQLAKGDWVGRLHFNNTRAAALEAESRLQAGVRFARLLRASLAELAEKARSESAMREVAVYEGVTWLRAHGGAVGFDAQPLPRGLRRWLLGLHFRLLIWTFAPVAHGSAARDVAPHRFRITRRALIDSFGVRRAVRSPPRVPRRDT